MFYYKYLDTKGNITQLESTTRVIKVNNVIAISKEEYDKIIEEMQAKATEEVIEELEV